MVIWISGMPGTGKSTLAKYYFNRQKKKLKNLILIDGDAFRKLITGRSTKNNVTKIYVHNASDDSLEGTSVFENTYNSANYLTKTIERHYIPGQTVPAQTTTINYYYY